MEILCHYQTNLWNVFVFFCEQSFGLNFTAVSIQDNFFGGGGDIIFRKLHNLDVLLCACTHCVCRVSFVNTFLSCF